MSVILVTLAQDVSRYNSGVQWVQWGTTGAGVGVLIAAAGCFFSKPKPGTSAMNVRIQKIAGAILAVVGIGLIIYAWTAHSTI